MSDSQEAKKQEWLADIAADQETTEADYAAAEAILRDAYLRTEHVDTGNLVRRGFVVVNPDGHHTAIIPFR
jgi:hypothetical protein